MPLRRPTRLLGFAVVAVAAVVVAASCSSSAGDSSEVAAADEPPYPDAITRELERRANERRPVPNSALPPRHLDVERFPDTLVERSQIVAGGPPPDGIGAVDDPVFDAVDDVDWLDDDELVLVLEVGGRARAYPFQVMIWHEIVNDEIAGVPVVVTYCPLCNSGVAFERTVDGEVLDFGTSGAVHQSALVMYDRQSESLWTHFDGRSVVGDRIGDELPFVPMSAVAWSDFRGAHPDGDVLGRIDPNQPYGRNPYGAYDQRDRPLAGFFTAELDERLPAMVRVVGLRQGDDRVAVTLETLTEAGVVAVDVDGRRVVVWHLPGASSALNAARVADGDDIGATGAFYSDRSFTRIGDRFVDGATGSAWNVLGMAVAGELLGERLEPVEHLDTFWFAWSTYHPETSVFAGDQ